MLILEIAYVSSQFNKDTKYGRPANLEESTLSRGPQQIQMAYAQGGCDLVDGDDGGISLAVFEAAQVLLGQAAEF
jgi:hypothetical protein